MDKIRVGILCGGRSEEHQVSLQSVKNILDAINKSRYDVVLIGIDRVGQWHLADPKDFLLNADNPKEISLNYLNDPILFSPGSSSKQWMQSETSQLTEKIDVIFPVLHGPFGEDGTVQGLLKLINLPFVGSGVLGSAISMDKDVMKRLLREAGVAIPDFMTFTTSNRYQINYNTISDRLHMPCFIKPANLGSSVGITKAYNVNDFEAGVDKAFQYDRKILIEEYIRGREIECAVLGTTPPEASGLGEIRLTEDFYSYEAKYIKDSEVSLEIPASLPPKITNDIRATAVKVHEILECEMMSRVDFFLRENGDFLVNELNTIPGFTQISMFPKLWQAAGVAYGDLIDKLLQLALKRFEEDQLINR